jgi:DNA mismatch repair protein MutS2
VSPAAIEQETLDLLEWPRLAAHLASFAATAAGRRHCHSLPLPDAVQQSRTLLAETGELLALDGLLEGGLSFQGVADIGPTVGLCSKGGTASGEALLEVAATLAAARRLRRQIEDPSLRPVTSALVAELRTLPELEQRLRFCLEEGGRVADRASAPLAALRAQLQGARAERRERLQDLLRRWGPLLQDTVIAERNGRPVLAVKAGAAAQLAGQVHDSSASGQTLFLEPEAVRALGNRIADLEGQERELEQAVLHGLSAELAEQAGPLEGLRATLVRLDAALARARYGVWLGAVRPELADTGDAPFDLCDLRHPLLLWQHRREGGSPVVPVTVRVGRELRVVAITGPNTGGKTVTLKSIGLAVLMARAGLFLPCRGTPRLPWCGRVLADIGDEQSLQQNLSTFSGHIRRIARILEALKAAAGAGVGASLVLLDEVGAGTDPQEGAALATALLQHLADRARLTVATTHFGELKALKYGDARFENASVAFDEETLAPTFHLQWGIPGRSNALAIARRLGLEPEVLERAAGQLAPRGQGEVNQVSAGLEEQRQRQQEAAEEAAALLARTELLHEELLSRWQQQQQQSAALQEQRRQHLERSIRQGQHEVRRIIRRLRQSAGGRSLDPAVLGETARQAGQRLKHLEQQHRPRPERREHGGWMPAVGDRVRVLSLGKAAEVMALADDGRELTVRCGVLRLTVPLEGIEGLQGEKPALPETRVEVKVPRTSQAPGPDVRTERNTVDVRGLRVHEAEAAVEETLRAATGPVWVIHGIGTGRLKRGLRAWLDTLPYVERVTDAERGDGGPGCSVVYQR